MSAKTLTDELRSVLLFHSLEAPEPNATVDRILAETVGPVIALGGHAEVPDSGARPARRRRLSAQQLSAAAVVAVLLLSVAGINSVRNRNAARSATSASQDEVSQRQQDASAAAGSMALPQASDNSLQPSDGSKAQAMLPPAYGGTRLDCSTIPGSKLMIGHTDDFRLSTDVEGYLFEYLCVAPNGQRSASEVQMFQLTAGQWQYVQTLAHPDDYEHLDSMTAGADSVLVQVSVNRPGGVPGEIRAMALTLSRPQDQNGSWTVAEPCLREDLTTTVTPVPDATAPSWRLSVRNHTATACALEGFPRVRAQRAGLTLTTAEHTLSGPAGGVTKQAVPPIIVLSQGATASAIIEQSGAAAGSCQRSDELSVELPNGVSLGRLRAELAGCGLVVHPLVGNARGSD
ncbi:MAG: DUF4232 domain-containing protein [Jatrophihabitantaceae bacterium]